MAEVLDASVFEPEEVDASALSGHGLVGLGSGVYWGRLYKRLRKFVQQLPPVENNKAFLFATQGHGRIPSRALEKLLAQKGYDVVGTFSCPGFQNWFPLNLFGGMNKGRPDADDLRQAKEFAASLKDKYQES